LDNDANNNKRVLAVEIRQRHLGYALFEASEQLIDWGTTALDRKGSPKGRLLQTRFTAVLQVTSPTLIVVRRSRHTSDVIRAHTKNVLRALRNAAGTDPLVVFIGQVEIKAAFGLRSNANKYSIADELAAYYPELLPKLPHHRKCWQTEPYGALVFDAVAVGYAFWLRSDSSSLPPT